MKIFIFSLIMIFSSTIAGATDYHTQLASKFNDLTSTSDYSSRINAYLEAFKQQIPIDENDTKKLKEYTLSVVNSPEFQNIKINIYKEMFTESELEQLIDFVQLPAYKILNDRKNEMIQKVSQATAPLLNMKIQGFVNELIAAKTTAKQ
jgi:hypothetical protein